MLSIDQNCLSTYFFLLKIRDPALVKKIGAVTAAEVRATGIPYVFAPCVAVSDQISSFYWGTTARKFLYNPDSFKCLSP